MATKKKARVRKVYIAFGYETLGSRKKRIVPKHYYTSFDKKKVMQSAEEEALGDLTTTYVGEIKVIARLDAKKPIITKFK